MRRPAAAFLIGGALLVLNLYGCATFVPKAPAPESAGQRVVRPFDPSLLSVGMQMQTVRRLEPLPEKIFTMRSGAMTVAKWVYESHGNTVTLYFANGILQSWPP